MWNIIDLMLSETEPYTHGLLEVRWVQYPRADLGQGHEMKLKSRQSAVAVVW